MKIERTNETQASKSSDTLPVSFCIVKPRDSRVVRESLRDKDGIKTPFAIIKLRSANCRKTAKGGHSE